MLGSSVPCGGFDDEGRSHIDVQPFISQSDWDESDGQVYTPNIIDKLKKDTSQMIHPIRQNSPARRQNRVPGCPPVSNFTFPTTTTTTSPAPTTPKEFADCSEEEKA